ncbi:MAG: MoxR family ATPase [Myxococcota bacterium]
MSTAPDTTTAYWGQATDPRHSFATLKEHLNGQVLGQPDLIERLLISMLADGHLLVEGAPGLAKTTAIKALAEAIEADDHRIQFTPDLLPGDVTGTDIFEPETAKFRFEPGPIFHNLVLADEINRAPAKVQSALLEAMAERQVTVGSQSYPLPELFLVMATQNPIEQEGTYNLPEAQLDRFLMYVQVNHPGAEVEHQVLQLVRNQARGEFGSEFTPVPQQTILAARRAVNEVHMADALEHYLVQLVLATRDPSPYLESLADKVDWGASPRGTIALDRCARSRAWLWDRDYVTPEDVLAVAPDVLRHRVLLSYRAKAEGMDANEFLQKLIGAVPLP